MQSTPVFMVKAMKTFYKRIGAMVQFYSMRLYLNNTVATITGTVGSIGEHKLLKFEDFYGAYQFVSNTAATLRKEYSHEPHINEVTLLIPMDGDEIKQLNVYEAINHLLQDTGNGEIGDGFKKGGVYTVPVFVIDKSLALQRISRAMAELGIAKFNAIS